jgi:nucleotide-binding universal stress UspA family protein
MEENGTFQRPVFTREMEGSAMKIYDPKKILVPVDFSELSPEVIQAAVEIGEIRNAEVEVLHVGKEPKYPSYYGDGYAPGTILPDKILEDARTRLEHQLEDMVRKVSTRAKVKTLILWGDPVKAIVQVAESGDFDLIVMATHGRKAVSRFFIGSVTEEVIRRAPCPVFVIRAKVGEERLAVPTLEGAEVSYS